MMTTRRGLLTMACTVPLALALAKPSLTGTWALDATRTTFAAPPDLVVTMEQRDSVLYVQTTWDRSRPAGLAIAGLLASQLELTTNGAASTNNVPPGLKLTSTSHWVNDKLITEWELTGLPSGSDHGVWTHYLTDDGKTMVVEQQSGVPAKLVFTKR
jgi:hypothetical protein